MVVLITGASGGIGKATAEYFLNMGHEVHGFDLMPAPELLLGEGAGEYVHHVGDVTDPATFPEDLWPEILINCAGVQNSIDDIDINLKGTILISCTGRIEISLVTVFFQPAA